MEISPSAPVLVGTDGSPLGCRTVAFAAAEAVRRRRDLLIVNADVGSHRSGAPLSPMTKLGAAQSRAAADEVLAEARQIALRILGTTEDDDQDGSTIRTAVTEGLPSQVLVACSTGAALTVVGRHGRSRLRHALGLGSTAAQVTAYASGPVIVVPELEVPTTGDAGVVVGVDDGEHAPTAIEFAFDEASRRRLPLTAVRGWTLLSEEPNLHAPVPGPVDLEDDQRRMVSESLAGWRAKYPDVDVRLWLVQRPAVSALVDTARDAALLVVGARGSGGFPGLRLGSVADAVVRRAPCPTAVVR